MAPQATLQRVRFVIGQDRALAVLIPEASRLRELNGRLSTILPSAIARACQVVAISDGEALLMCGNAAAAARVRGMASTVARALSDPRAGVDRVKVRVRADWARQERPPKRGLGPGALSAWDGLEHDLPDGPLKAAVDGLLRHHRKA